MKKRDKDEKNIDKNAKHERLLHDLLFAEKYADLKHAQTITNLPIVIDE